MLLATPAIRRSWRDPHRFSIPSDCCSSEDILSLQNIMSIEYNRIDHVLGTSYQVTCILTTRSWLIRATGLWLTPAMRMFLWWNLRTPPMGPQWPDYSGFSARRVPMGPFCLGRINAPTRSLGMCGLVKLMVYRNGVTDVLHVTYSEVKETRRRLSAEGWTLSLRGDLMAAYTDIISIIGGAASNSHVSGAETDSFAALQSWGDAWLAKSESERTIAIVSACSWLETVDWEGTRCTPSTTDDGVPQALSWPRSGASCDGVAASCTMIPNDEAGPNPAGVSAGGEPRCDHRPAWWRCSCRDLRQQAAAGRPGPGVLSFPNGEQSSNDCTSCANPRGDQ